MHFLWPTIYVQTEPFKAVLCSVADTYPFDTDPDLKKNHYGSGSRPNFDMDLDQGKTIRIQIWIQAKKDSGPAKSQKFYLKNAHIPGFVVGLHYLTITFL